MLILFMKTYWKQVLVGVIVLGCILYVQALRIEVANKSAALAKSEAANKELTSALTALNQSIDVLAKGTENVKQNFDKLGKDVKAGQSALDKQLAGILKENKPVSCEDAIKYLRDAKYK